MFHCLVSSKHLYYGKHYRIALSLILMSITKGKWSEHVKFTRDGLEAWRMDFYELWNMGDNYCMDKALLFFD